MRLFVLIAVLALVAAACGTDTASPTDDPGDSPGETTDPGATDDPGDSPDPGTGGELDTYTLGIFQDVTTDNRWNMYDTAGNTVWNSYFLAPMDAGAYTIAMPGIELQPVLADGELQPAEQDGDVWVGTITLRDDIQWSDGEPITAEDFAFTWQTAVDFQLTANWQDFVDSDIVTAVEAVDDQTVQVTFNAQPGLAQWGPGTGVPLMPVMPEHFWAPVVEEAANAEDPRTELIAASGADAPSSGPTVFSDRQEGSFAASVANENYYDQGTEQSSGGVTWTEGPYASEFQYPLYGGQEAAVLALANGEVDFLLNPLGMQRGFQDQVAENEDLTAIVNPTNGFRFMAFNHARAPMSDPAFRDALTALINKEFVTGNLLQGVAFPLYVILPEGNVAWYNEEAAAELAEIGYAGLEDNERRQIAIDLLTEAGYTWETAPTIEDGTFTAGQGLIGPDGEPVGQLELITPTASYDPLRATFGNYISGVAQEMGINLVSIPTDFNKIVADVFATDADNNYTSDFDMFILGYSLGNAAFPTFHGSFFATGGDSNNTQYSSEEYDAASAAFDAAQTEEEAYEAMWEMERLIAIDKPHVPLFDTGILEFYNNRVAYPFTETLSGLQFISGAPAAVTAR
ncbi:MAG TPA: ABC transporter substrate-binding protein [Candidatus Limnocylindrales bacterium]|nr:ABC transporter substrate-binding protein [Candidatus Limnocylindrales bacterium]